MVLNNDRIGNKTGQFDLNKFYKNKILGAGKYIEVKVTDTSGNSEQDDEWVNEFAYIWEKNIF